MRRPGRLEGNLTSRLVRLLNGLTVVFAVSAFAVTSASGSAGNRPLLVFSSVRAWGVDGAGADEFGNLVTLGIDGRGLRRLTTAREAESDPAWSPDGRQIAFNRGIGTSCNGGHCDLWQGAEIWVVDATGTNARRITQERSPGSDPVAEFADRYPTWSPDGERIAFVHARTVEGSAQDASDDGVYVVGVHGRGLHRVLRTGQGALVDWSPDGKTLAVVRNGRVGVLDLRTGTISYVGRGDSASWSPNGHSLAVTRASGIYVVAAQGGAVRRVVPLAAPAPRRNDLSNCLGVTWSPDGRQLAFSGMASGRQDPARGGNVDLFIVDVDGSDLKRITANPFGDLAPDWRP